MKTKTTNEDFEKFQKYVKEWIEKLGLRSWQIYFVHEALNDRFAETHWQQKAATATIRLGKDWKRHEVTDEQLNHTALHECLHIVMAPLFSEATARFTCEYDIEQSEESIVVQLTNIIGGQQTDALR